MSIKLLVAESRLLVVASLLSACAVESTGDDGGASAGSSGTSPTGGSGAVAGSGGSSGVTASGGTGGAVANGGAGGSKAGAGGSSGSGPAAGVGGSTAGASASGGAGAGGDAGATAAGTAGTSAGAGGAAAGQGGSAGSPGGSGGAAGSPVGGNGGTGGAPPPLDCGAQGWAVENHGPPKNRVNYVILGDGYTATTVETTLVQHINTALTRRFTHESGQPYARYRNFVNICVMKAVSANDGIGNGPTAFDGGNGGDRLAKVSSQKVNAYIKANVPSTFEVNWKAVVLNQDIWENTGSVLMLWSGANRDAPGAALHEGGHGFHQLADEYCAKATGTACGANTSGTGTSGTEYQEVNSAGNPMTTGGKWDLWMGTTQKGLNVPDMGATGVQGTFVGSRYVDTGQYRPSGNSMMNSLFGSNVNTSFNSVSREQMIYTIWRAVVPVDSAEPPAGAVSNPAQLKLNVIDANVISVDWTVDGVTTVNAGPVYNAAGLSAGTHMISAKAYDNASMDLVKNRTGVCPTAVRGSYCAGTAWPRSQQTVTWTVTKT